MLRTRSDISMAASVGLLCCAFIHLQFAGFFVLT